MDWRERIEAYLGESLQLTLNPRERLAPVANGIDFLGYIVRRFAATALVQQLQLARAQLHLEDALHKLDKYAVLILDDFGYVKKSEQETQVLFELIAHRYETGSLIVTSNKPFAWIHVHFLLCMSGDSARFRGCAPRATSWPVLGYTLCHVCASTSDPHYVRHGRTRC